MKPTIIHKDAFKAQRDVDFFLRLHRHLPDRFCGGIPFSSCNYRPDGIAINKMNDYVSELQKDPAFVAKEKEIEQAVRAQSSVIKRVDRTLYGEKAEKKFNPLYQV